MTHQLARRVAAAQGMSLVEATIILLTVATLSAILAPTINGYVDQARRARALTDEQVISNAISAFIADNAESQFLLTPVGATAGQPPTRPDGNRVNLLISDGDVPPYNAALGAGESFWTQAYNGGTVDSLSNHLIENIPGDFAVATRYRNPNDIIVATPGGNNIDFARTDSSGFNAPFSWRGPYLRGPVDPDPWGNRYAVNVLFLDPNPTAVVAGITAGFASADYPRLDVFVLSAGPDKELDTKSAQDGAVPGDDDVIFIVSSNAK